MLIDFSVRYELQLIEIGAIDRSDLWANHSLTLRDMLFEPISGEISPLQDGFGAITDVQPVEQWAFAAEEGDVIALRASVVVGDLEPTLMLWGPDHRPLGEGIRDISTNKQVVLWEIIAPLTGTYTVTVGREGGHTSGEYRLMLRHASISSQAARARDVTLNTQVAGYTAGKSTAYLEYPAGIAQ